LLLDVYNTLLLLYYSQLLSYSRTLFSGPEGLMYSIRFYYFPDIAFFLPTRILFHSTVCVHTTQFLQCTFFIFSVRIVVHWNLMIILLQYSYDAVHTRARSKLVLLDQVEWVGVSVSSELTTIITHTMTVTGGVITYICLKTPHNDYKNYFMLNIIIITIPCADRRIILWLLYIFFFWCWLTRAPMNLASSNSCLRGSRAAWKWCSILTLAPIRNTKPWSEKLSTNQMKACRRNNIILYDGARWRIFIMFCLRLYFTSFPSCARRQRPN